MGWHWHQLDHMQIICTSLQADNHATQFLQAFPATQPAASEHWRSFVYLETITTTTILRLSGFCPGQPGWADTRRNIHPLTPIASRSQRVSLIVIPFCLSVWMSVGHSAIYSLPRLIDHNQIWSAAIHLSLDPCKPFWIPYLPYLPYWKKLLIEFREKW